MEQGNKRQCQRIYAPQKWPEAAPQIQRHQPEHASPSPMTLKGKGQVHLHFRQNLCGFGGMRSQHQSEHENPPEEAAETA